MVVVALEGPSVDASVSALSVARHYKFFEVLRVFLLLILVAMEEAHQLPGNKQYLHYKLLCFCIMCHCISVPLPFCSHLARELLCSCLSAKYQNN